jgi:hypothetical protein
MHVHVSELTYCVLNINILFLQIQLHESTGVHTLAEVKYLVESALDEGKNRGGV